MQADIFNRVIEEARYIIKTGDTVRGTAKVFISSKSTVHKDVTERLRLIDLEMYRSVQRVLKTNLAERHIRGGNATKIKYQKAKNAKE